MQIFNLALYSFTSIFTTTHHFFIHLSRYLLVISHIKTTAIYKNKQHHQKNNPHTSNENQKRPPTQPINEPTQFPKQTISTRNRTDHCTSDPDQNIPSVCQPVVCTDNARISIMAGPNSRPLWGGAPGAQPRPRPGPRPDPLRCDAKLIKAHRLPKD